MSSEPSRATDMPDEDCDARWPGATGAVRELECRIIEADLCLCTDDDACRVHELIERLDDAMRAGGSRG